MDAEQAVRQTIQEVLERHEFQPTKTVPSLLERILNWLAPKWDIHIPSIPSWVGWLLLAILIASVLFALYKVIDWNFKSIGKRSPKATPYLMVEDIEGDGLHSWGEVLKKAQDALNRSDLRTALWLSHRLLLTWLDNQALIVFDRSKVNNIYLRECPNTSSQYSLLYQLTNEYEKVVYGQLAGSKPRVQDMLDALGRL